jgi:putative endonuclease
MENQFKGFTNKYNIDMLVWFESGNSVESAINLEKKIKNRRRQWKIDLIEKHNPNWRDLSKGFSL